MRRSSLAAKVCIWKSLKAGRNKEVHIVLVLFKLLVYVVLPPVLALIGVHRERARGDSAGGRYLIDRLLFWYLVIAVGVAGSLSKLS